MTQRRWLPEAASDDLAINRGIAVLRVALVPIALLEVPHRSNDLAVDLYPVLVGILVAYALAQLLVSFAAPSWLLPPLVQACLDLALIAALVYTSGGAVSPLRFSFYVLPIVAAVRLSPWVTAAWTTLALAAYLLVTVVHPQSRAVAETHLIVEESLTLIWVGAAAVMLSTLVGRRSRSFEALADSRRELALQALSAEARERRRLAQVLHDDAIQNVLLARQEVTDLERGVEGSGGRAKQALDETHRQLRDEVFSMHPVGLERAGAAAVIEHFAQDAARRAHFDLDVVVDAKATGSGELLYASAREILTNVAKHARASRVEVRLDRWDGGVTLTVGDDGVGFGPDRLAQALAGGHIGLAAVTERVRAVGGDVRIDSVTGQGTTITVRLPSED